MPNGLTEGNCRRLRPKFRAWVSRKSNPSEGRSLNRLEGNSVSESIALIISALALAVAGYGILERRAAAYAALRVRITELIGDIGELNVEEARIESDQGAGETAASDDDGPIEFISQRGYMETMASLSGRRALLTYQVLSLLARLRPRRLVRQREPFDC